MWSISLKEIFQILKYKIPFLLIGVFLACYACYAWAQEGELPPVEDDPLFSISSLFQGQWLPALDPLKIGKDNFKTLQNLRYTDKGLKGVDGYSAINTNIVNATNYRIKNGFHFRKEQPQESHVLIQAENSGGTASAIYENETAIPNTGDFTATALHTDSSGYGLGRFSPAPQGNVVYANGVETMIWGGDELRCSAFMTGTTTITDTITGVRDFSAQVQNTQTTSDQIAVIGGGNDSDTVLMLHMNGADASTTFTDSSATPHSPTAQGDAQLDTDQKKYGTASGLFDGTGDYVEVGDHDDFDFDSGNFTIDWWARFDDFPQYHGQFGQYIDMDNYLLFDIWDAAGRYYAQFKAANSGATIALNVSDFATLSTGVWYHFAIIRGWGGNANDWAITFNGAAIVTLTLDQDMPNLTGNFYIGKRLYNVANYYHKGWIDEFRVSKGIARWTSDFTPSARQYQADSRHWLVGATRPLQGAKFYVQNANLTSGQTVTAKEWNGSAWDDLSTTDNTNGLSQTGTVTWSSTVNTSKPKYLEGLYLYFYQFALSDGEADIYYVTVDSPWQDMVDIWDGVLRQPIQFQVEKNGTYEDYTLEVNEPSSGQGEFSATVGGTDADDHILIQFEERMAGIRFQMVGGDNNLANVDATLNYWNGEDWTLVSAFSDLTSGGTETLNQTGVMAWSPPDISEEFIREDFGSVGYSYKITFDGTLTATSTNIDLVGGVPAQLIIPPFSFPSKYRDRVLLCGYKKAGEGNRVDYSLTNAPDVWNGYETSMGGLQSLYFGGDEALTCGTQIYNRFGANVFAMWVALKANETYLLLGSTPDPESSDRFKIYPVSKNIGCPAPLTLDTAEVGYEVSTEIIRNVAIWLSNSGPVLFDGAVLMPLKGIENYFDRQNSECINFDYISTSRGWYDNNFYEYNLLFPSGSSTTVPNIWLVYDLKRHKWYEKNPGAASYPWSAWEVMDTNGIKYYYSGVSTGYTYRLENGYDWNGTAISQVVETGDFFPAGEDIWYESLIRQLKLVAGRITQGGASVSIDHYADTATSSTELTAVDLTTGSARLIKDTQNTNQLAWAHRLKFTSSRSGTTTAFEPIAWGVRGRTIRIEE